MGEDLEPAGSATLSSLGDNLVALVVGLIFSTVTLLAAVFLVGALARGGTFGGGEIALLVAVLLVLAAPAVVGLGLGLAWRRVEVDLPMRRIRIKTVKWFGLFRSAREIALEELKFVEISAKTAHNRTGQMGAVMVSLAVHLRDEPVRRKARVALTGEIAVASGSALLEKLLATARGLAGASGTRLVGPRLLASSHLGVPSPAPKLRDLSPTLLLDPQGEEGSWDRP